MRGTHRLPLDGSDQIGSVQDNDGGLSSMHPNLLSRCVACSHRRPANAGCQAGAVMGVDADLLDRSGHVKVDGDGERPAEREKPDEQKFGINS